MEAIDPLGNFEQYRNIAIKKEAQDRKYDTFDVQQLLAQAAAEIARNNPDPLGLGNETDGVVNQIV